jgi:hypothetical protein
MTERRDWAWRATREVILGRDADRPESLWISGQTRTVYTPLKACMLHSVSMHSRIMTGSASMALDFTWQIRPAIGPAVNSDNRRMIGPLLFVYKEWPLGERRLSLLGIDDILLVSHRSVLQPEGLS